ncbi:HD domain-containing phosphohydrolase [Chloroflexota bacterium]
MSGRDKTEVKNATAKRPPVDFATDELLLAEKQGLSLWSGPVSKEETKPANTPDETQEYKTRLNLLHDVSREVASSSQLTRLVEKITRMTQNSLNAAASSVLLLDREEEELLFEVAQGDVRKQLKKVKFNAQAGIAGWVTTHSKPLIINDVTQDPRFNADVDKTTGFVTRSIICAPLIVHRKTIGVIEVLNKIDGSSFTGKDLEALVSVASTAAMSIENLRLHQAIVDAYKGTIKALAAAIDAKDHYTRGHSQRVTEYGLLAANQLSFPDDELEIIEYACILHDIGKIGVPENILGKPAALTMEEQKIVAQHTITGADMLKDISFLKKARVLILHHHERYDGSGYPKGIIGQAIPMGARLIAVCDAFDAMTTDRPYRRALSKDYAIGELYRCSGQQFCPVSVDALIAGFQGFHFHKNAPR